MKKIFFLALVHIWLSGALHTPAAAIDPGRVQGGLQRKMAPG